MKLLNLLFFLSLILYGCSSHEQRSYSDYIFNEDKIPYIDDFYTTSSFLEIPDALFLIDVEVLNFQYDNETKIKTIHIAFDEQDFEVILNDDKKVPYIHVGGIYKFSGYNELNLNGEIIHNVVDVFIK